MAWLILNTWGARIPWGKARRHLAQGVGHIGGRGIEPLWDSNSASTTETSSLEVEVTVRTMSMLETSFSITRVISVSTSAAAAPGINVMTLI